MGQLAHLENNFVTNLKSSTEMTPKGSRPHRSPRWNFPPIDPVENELVRDPGSVGGPHSSHSPVPARNPTSGPNLVPALIPALVPTPTSAPVPTNELFKKFMRAYLESNQGPR